MGRSVVRVMLDPNARLVLPGGGPIMGGANTVNCTARLLVGACSFTMIRRYSPAWLKLVTDKQRVVFLSPEIFSPLNCHWNTPWLVWYLKHYGLVEAEAQDGS